MSVASSDFALPGIGSFTDENHEVHLAQLVSTLCSQGKSAQKRALITLSALKILLALKIRPETREGYGDIIFPGNYFQFYPINLKSFLVQSEQAWNDLTIREWIYLLCSSWGLNTHFKVALRKLRGQSQSTFRIRPSDQGLEVIMPPEAVFTSPRFHQSFRILKDIGALVRREIIGSLQSWGGNSRNTPMSDGISILEEIKRGGYEASLMTTFNAYLPFYEDVVLRHLSTNGVRHNILMMDGAQATRSIQSHPPRLAGRHYTLIPMRSARAFHPKVIFLAGKNKGALLVGSHNMTLSGFGYNRELTNLVRVMSLEDKEAVSLLQNAWQQIVHWASSQVTELPMHIVEMVTKTTNFARG